MLTYRDSKGRSSGTYSFPNLHEKHKTGSPKNKPKFASSLLQQALPSGAVSSQQKRSRAANKPPALDIAGTVGGAPLSKESFRGSGLFEEFGQKSHAVIQSPKDERSKSQHDVDHSSNLQFLVPQKTVVQGRALRTRREKVQAVIERITTDPEFMLTEEYLKEDTLKSPEFVADGILRFSRSSAGKKF